MIRSTMDIYILPGLHFTQFDLDQIWFMPNGMPPHKKQSSIESDIHERIAMTRIAIKANKQFYLQEYEAKREKVSYSYKTMEHFRKMYPDDEFYFIIGADSLFFQSKHGNTRKDFLRHVLFLQRAEMRRRPKSP